MPLLPACPDMSVARSVSVELGTSMAVDFDDRSREIQDTAAAMLELADTSTTTVGTRCFRNPSLVTENDTVTAFNDYFSQYLPLRTLHIIPAPVNVNLIE